RTEKVSLTPTADKPNEVSLKMAPLDRVVHVKSDPAGATVLIDGKAAGKTPADIKLVGKLDPRVPHQFALRKAGFEDEQTTISRHSWGAPGGDSGGMGLSVSLTPLKRAAPPPQVKAAVKAPSEPSKSEPAKGEPAKAAEPPKAEPPKTEAPK